MTFPQSLVPTRLCCAFSSIFIYHKNSLALDFTLNCVIILITIRFLTVLHFQAFSSIYDVIASLSTVLSVMFLSTSSGVLTMAISHMVHLENTEQLLYMYIRRSLA